MAGRQVGKLHSPAREKWIAGNEKCVGASVCKTCEGHIDLAAGACIEDIGLQSHCASSQFDVFERGFSSETDGAHDHCHTNNRRYQLAKEFQPFCG